MELSEKQKARYFHHIILKDIGGEGQKKLFSSSVLIVGAGGLGSPAALYLAAAGVGKIGIVDSDIVEESNLQRQILHSEADLGRKKVDSARESILGLNSSAQVVAIGERLTEKNAAEIISGYDFVIDACDNFPTKFLINDVAVSLGKSFSHAGVVGFKGQTFTHTAGHMCLRCLFPDLPENGMIANCRGSGTLGAAVGIVGAVQAAEAVKFILGSGELLLNRLLSVDALSMKFREVRLAKNSNCQTCSD